MNKTIEELCHRKSVREFTEEVISPQEKQLILQSAVEAPTAGNQQLYTILDITDQGIKDKLAISCDNQPFIAKASMVLIFCADCKKWYDAFVSGGCSPRLPQVGDLLLAISDANIAAQNAVTGAWSLGVGSCYIGDIMEGCEYHRELLQLPEYVFPTAMLVFGYPSEKQLLLEKPKRQPMEYIVQENYYHTLNSEELQRMLEEKAGIKPYEQWLNAFCQRKYNSDFSKEMSRSVAVYLSQFGENS